MIEWLRVKHAGGGEGIIRVEDIGEIIAGLTGDVTIVHRYNKGLSAPLAVKGSLDDFAAALNAETSIRKPVQPNTRAYTMRPIHPQGDPTIPCRPDISVDVMFSTGTPCMNNVKADSIDWSYVAAWRVTP